MSDIKQCVVCEKEMNMSDKTQYKTLMHNQMHRYVCSSKCMTKFYEFK